MMRLLSSVAFMAVVAVDTSAQTAPHAPPVLLQMIRDDAVHDELRLDETQRTAVLDILRHVDGDWFRARNLPAGQQNGQHEALTAKARTELAKSLSAGQMERLAQLERQALGTRMFIRQDVIRGLALTADQTTDFSRTFVDTDRKSSEIQKQVRSGESDAAAGQRALEALKAKERKALVARLTTEQRAKLGDLTGKPFDFSRVKRRYPLAPELKLDGVTWIQGGPLSLEDLRGKVVAVHYYAYQCINCKRNLPHYDGWHKDYADKDLVVIGIQTPETESERSLERVTAAAASDGIEYPVMLDAEAANWKTWSNTMWPTVYLIDKKGFLRRWWQGEMNWQGTPGEQQMRSTIEMLLAEEG